MKLPGLVVCFCILLVRFLACAIEWKATRLSLQILLVALVSHISRAISMLRGGLTLLYPEMEVVRPPLLLQTPASWFL